MKVLITDFSRYKKLVLTRRYMLYVSSVICCELNLKYFSSLLEKSNGGYCYDNGVIIFNIIILPFEY